MKTYDERAAAVMEMVAAKKKKRAAVAAAVSSAAVAVVILVVCLTLFLPLGTAGGNPGGAYAGVLQAVNRRIYRNNWEKLMDAAPQVSIGGLGASKSADLVMEDAVNSAAKDNSSSARPNGAGSASEREQYVENTNLQVAGVREGDVLKESSRYFYRLRRNAEAYDTLQLDVFEKAGLDTQCVSTYRFAPREQDEGYLNVYEMYLSDDAAALTVVLGYNTYAGYYYDYDDVPDYTYVVRLDLSDLQHIRVARELTISGAYRTSRMIDGQLLVATYYTAEYPEDSLNYASYVPHVRLGDAVVLVAPEHVNVCAEETARIAYTVVTRFDADLSLAGQVALFGVYSDTFYVNKERVYVVNNTWSGDGTEIYCVQQQADGLRSAGRVWVNGTVRDQYSMDEYQGVLRVATTIYYPNSNDDGTPYRGWVSSNAGLYCFRVGTWETVGKVEGFAPDGESVQSVRFEGTKAYVCTAVLVTDPVFCFDLSDYAHITAVDTGTIPGFSLSLTPFSDGTMLGIGVGERFSQIKVSVYRADGAAVEVVGDCVVGGDTETAGGIAYCEDFGEYKRYLLNAEAGLVGVPCRIYRNTQDWSEEEQDYLLFTYRDGVLRPAAQVKLRNLSEYSRAALSDGYIYLFAQEDYKVLALADLD